MASSLCGCLCCGTVLLASWGRGKASKITCKPLDPHAIPASNIDSLAQAVGASSPRYRALCALVHKEMHREEMVVSMLSPNAGEGGVRAMDVSRRFKAGGTAASSATSPSTRAQRVLGGRGIVPLDVVRARAAETGLDLDRGGGGGRGGGEGGGGRRSGRTEEEEEAEAMKELEELDWEQQDKNASGIRQELALKGATGLSLLKNSLAILREDLSSDLALKGGAARYERLGLADA